MVSEWAKKVECWETIRETELELPEPLPPDMQVQRARSPINGERLGRGPVRSKFQNPAVLHSTIIENIRRPPPT
jgi:hypothetical protein